MHTYSQCEPDLLVPGNVASVFPHCWSFLTDEVATVYAMAAVHLLLAVVCLAALRSFFCLPKKSKPGKACNQCKLAFCLLYADALSETNQVVNKALNSWVILLFNLD